MLCRGLGPTHSPSWGRGEIGISLRLPGANLTDRPIAATVIDIMDDR